MNLTKSSKTKVRKSQKNALLKKSKTIAIAGNPNVGKSTVFNALTGLNQHTGNWPGKTVQCARGKYVYGSTEFKLVDLPGTYSLISNSPEEEIARNFICFENPDAVIITVDATCLERSLNLAIQILELTKNAVICLNLIDEANHKKIHIDVDELSLQLGVPVIATNARKGTGLNELMENVEKVAFKKIKTFRVKNDYGDDIEKSLEKIESVVEKIQKSNVNSRWISVRLLESNPDFSSSFENTSVDYSEIEDMVKNELINLSKKNLSIETIQEKISESLIKRAEKIYNLCVKIENRNYDNSDRKIDKILTSKITGFPIMILMLFGIFWITIVGANYPSEIIASVLFKVQDILLELMKSANSPPWLYGILIEGIYRTLAWVISVMLPPMAIFFPLFTFLEDIGYLPRAAFNMDNIFKKSGAHGKQALTMCMGFGCNACGIIGCRIIDSPRERIIGILTNNFVPCNGRFPLLISVITMFFIGNTIPCCDSLFKALILTGAILFGISITFLTSKLLSMTILKGVPSSFILELPPYRKPQLGKILIHSVMDRTIFVLGRAVAVAAPAGLIIWLAANLKINDVSVLMHLTNYLNPFAKSIGLDGVILMAFILGFPANEIVFPIIIMSYMCTGSILELDDLTNLHALLIDNGWTYITAICVMIFSIMHFPCGTTCWTIKKETGSLKWTFLSFIIPTAMGIAVCYIVSHLLNCIKLL